MEKDLYAFDLDFVKIFTLYVKNFMLISFSNFQNFIYM